MSIRDFLQIGRRRKWWIIVATTAVFVCTVVVTMRIPDIYRAETVILVDPQKVPDNYVPSTVSTSISDRLSTIQQEVLSPARLQRLIDSLGLYSELKGRLTQQQIVVVMQRAITVQVVNPGQGRLSAFKIAFYGKNPKEVALVANQLAAMFIQENLNVRQQQSIGTADFLGSELQEIKKQVDEKEGQIQRIKSRFILDLPESKQYHLEALTNLRNQLRDSQDRVNRARQEKVLLQTMAASTPEMVDLDEAQMNSPYQPQIQKLEAHLSELQARYGPTYPDVRKVQSELEALKKKAVAAANRVTGDPALPLGGGRRNPVIEAQVQKLNQEIEQETRRQPQLQEQINFHVSKLERVPVFEREISGLMRDYDSLRGHYHSLLDKKLSAEMSSALETRQKAERFVVLDTAQVPERPFGPNRILLSLAGLIGGLLAGIGLTVLAEMTDESVRSESEAVRILGKPVFAGIPRIKTKQQRRLESLRAIGTVAGTAVCSAALGLLISNLTLTMWPF